MTFEQALYEIKTGVRDYMRLPEWSPDVKIMVQRPDKFSRMTAPYLYVSSRFGMVPWIPTQIEIFSMEWGTA